MKRIIIAALALMFAAPALTYAQNDTIPTFDVKENLTEALLDEILCPASVAPSYPRLSTVGDERPKADIIKEDRESWEWGDYVMTLDGEAYYSSAKTVSLRNRVTGEYIIPRFTKRDIKKYLKPGLPDGTFYIEQGAFWGDGRIKFLDSSKQGTPKELDGLVYIDAEIFKTTSYNKHRTYHRDYTGLYRIEGNKLKPVVELHNYYYPEKGYLLLYPFPAIGAYRHEEIKVGNDTHKYPVADIYSYDGRLLCKDVMSVQMSRDGETVWVLDKETIGDLKEHFANKWKFSEYEYKPFDKYLNPLHTFDEYDFVSPRQSVTGFRYVVAGKGESYGALDEKGNVIIPFLYVLPMQVDEIAKAYWQVGFTPWLQKSVAKYVAQKDEFEKQDHFDARRENPALQKEFILSKLPNAQLEYLESSYAKGYTLTLGKYDSERELFPIYVSPGSWNSFTLAIPIDEAQAFKAAFDSIKEDALKRATFQIRYDAIALEDITFTLPDGKFYQLHIE